MQYIEYPIAQTLTEATAWLNSGGELWQEMEELEEDDPEGTCFEIDNEVDLIDCVNNEDDIHDYNIHMVSNED